METAETKTLETEEQEEDITEFEPDQPHPDTPKSVRIQGTPMTKHTMRHGRNSKNGGQRRKSGKRLSCPIQRRRARRSPFDTKK